LSNAVSRLYIRDARTRRVHEVSRAGSDNVTTFCGREYREQSRPGLAAPYDQRTTWPNPRVPRCKHCIKKALSGRT
jgi:hypothetical protein